jgi:D-alanyl-D-alanine dipeptidase
MRTLRRGDEGAEVKLLQERLRAFEGTPLNVDGDFGELTEAAVERFQEQRELLVDGIVGRDTWRALGVEDFAPDWGNQPVEWLGWKKIACDMTVPGQPDKGFDSTTLRVDVADAFERVRMRANSAGAKLTSAGGRRKVARTANRNQSKKSMHYVGRAHDLALPSGMQNPLYDAYLVEPDPEHPGYWIVWARAEQGEERIIDAWVHTKQDVQRVTARVINLTDLLAEFGFQRIRKRSSYRRSNYGAAEWWHFQKTDDLVVGESLFGEELLKVWRLEDLEGTVPWEHRDAVFGVDWF